MFAMENSLKKIVTKISILSVIYDCFIYKQKNIFFCFLSSRRLSFILNASLGSFFGIAFADWAFFSDHK